MADYFVSLPITGTVSLHIIADSNEDAVKKAIAFAEKEELLIANPKGMEVAMGYEVNYVESTTNFTKRRNSTNHETDYKQAWAGRRVEDYE